MIWLFIGVLVGLAAIPVLHRALVALEASLASIDGSLTQIAAECQLIVKALDGVPALVETEQLTGAVPGLVGNYVTALTPLL